MLSLCVENDFFTKGGIAVAFDGLSFEVEEADEVALAIVEGNKYLMIEFDGNGRIDFCFCWSEDAELFDLLFVDGAYFLLSLIEVAGEDSLVILGDSSIEGVVVIGGVCVDRYEAIEGVVAIVGCLVFVCFLDEVAISVVEVLIFSLFEELVEGIDVIGCFIFAESVVDGVGLIVMGKRALFGLEVVVGVVGELARK